MNCQIGFPWVVGDRDGFLGANGVKLWSLAEFTGSADRRVQTLRQSVAVFATAQNDGINTLAERAAHCRQAEMHNLGRVQLVLEFDGDWNRSEIARVRAAAIAAAAAL